MAETQRLWPGGPLFLPDPHAPLSTDSVLLAGFTRADSCRKGIDLGCASGALLLMLLGRTERLHMTGLELREEAAALGRKNLRLNGWEERGEIRTGDLREHRSLFPAGGFDLAVANPPYYPEGGGARSPDRWRDLARREDSCRPEELIRAAAWLLREGGRFALVHKPERLVELLSLMSGNGLEPKRLRFSAPRPGAAPNLALVEGRRGGKPGLSVEPTLILRDETGEETAELRRIYRRE